jgi:hypothetical protein
MVSMKEPIHIAKISGQAVRFFAPPDVGKPDFPWVAEDDIYRAAGFSPEERQSLARIMSNAPDGNPMRTIATSGGIVKIAPHHAAQGFLAAIAESGWSDLRAEYTNAAVAAFKQFARDWPWQVRLQWMLAAAGKGEVDLEPAG